MRGFIDRDAGRAEIESDDDDSFLTFAVIGAIVWLFARRQESPLVPPLLKGGLQGCPRCAQLENNAETIDAEIIENGDS